MRAATCAAGVREREACKMRIHRQINTHTHIYIYTSIFQRIGNESLPHAFGGTVLYTFWYTLRNAYIIENEF